MTPNLFTVDQGQKFCINQCNSNLASIHNQHELSQAIKTINDGRQEFDSSRDVWIGLESAINTTDFSWIDGSLFNYGNTSSTATSP